MMKTAISWSAGKDSCLALLRAREAGHDVQTFLTMCEADGFSKSHALAPAVMPTVRTPSNHCICKAEASSIR